MRLRQRLYVSLILAGVFQMLSVVPALAWWEWLDPLSGPKGLKGPQFEARLVCFGSELPSNLRTLLSTADTDMANAVTLERQKPGSSDVTKAWIKLTSWNAAALAQSRPWPWVLVQL